MRSRLQTEPISEGKLGKAAVLGGTALGLVILSAVIALASAGLAFAQFPAPVQQKVAHQEYAVYDAAIGRWTVGEHGYVMIGDFTSSFQCGANSENGFQLGGCDGLRTSSETPSQAIDSVRGSLGGIRESTIADFLRKNTREFPLQREFILPFKYFLFGRNTVVGPAPSKEEGSPDFAFYLSRVGFSKDSKQALVFVNHINWTNRRLSGGDYVLLEVRKNRWAVGAARKFWW